MRRWWIISLGVVSLDVATKWLIQTMLPYATVIPVTSFFNVVHYWNTGAAFGFLADAGGWQRYFFLAMAIVVSGVLAWMLRRPQPRGEALAYSLIVGGALGNALDRGVRGYVVDFLDFHWRDWHWPAFNVADIAITSAVALLILSTFRPAARSAAHD